MARFGRHSPRPSPPAPVPVVQDRPGGRERHQGGNRLGEMLVESRLVDRGAVLAALEPKRKRRAAAAGPAAARQRRHLRARPDHRPGPPEPAGRHRPARRHARNPQALALIRRGDARRLLALPLAFEGNTVVVAVADGTEGRPPASARRSAAPVRLAARRAVRHHAGDRQQLPRPRRRRDQVRAFEARDSVRRDAVRTESRPGHDDAPVVQVVQHDHHPGAAGPGLGHPHRAAATTGCGCGTASTARCTTCWTCPARWARRWSAGSRSWAA